LKWAVVTRGNHITGVVTVDTALHRGLKEGFTGVALRDVAHRNFIIAWEDDVMVNVMTRMARRGASIAVVVKGRSRPYASHVIGIISKEHIADWVTESIRPYAE
jgi:CBS domain containing-hemolysin-like protein